MQSHNQLAVHSNVASLERFDTVGPLCKQRYVRFTNFLQSVVAEAADSHLQNSLKCKRVDITGITRQESGQREWGDANFDVIRTCDYWQTPEVVRASHDLFARPWFDDLLSLLMSFPIVFIRPATENNLGSDDHICLHGDLSDSCLCAFIVLGLTKNWQRENDGNTVSSEVTRIEDLPTLSEVPLQLRRCYPGRSKAVLI